MLVEVVVLLVMVAYNHLDVVAVEVVVAQLVAVVLFPADSPNALVCLAPCHQ